MWGSGHGGGDRHRAGGLLEELAGVGWQDEATRVPSACLWPGSLWMAQALGCGLRKR